MTQRSPPRTGSPTATWTTETTANVLVGNRHELRFTPVGKAVLLGTSTAKTGAAMEVTFTGETGTYAPAKIRTYAK